MIGLYFSGTGFTRHCVKLFARETGAEAVSIEADSAPEMI
jgi:flavodoxin